MPTVPSEACQLTLALNSHCGCEISGDAAGRHGRCSRALHEAHVRRDPRPKMEAYVSPCKPMCLLSGLRSVRHANESPARGQQRRGGPPRRSTSLSTSAELGRHRLTLPHADRISADIGPKVLVEAAPTCINIGKIVGRNRPDVGRIWCDVRNAGRFERPPDGDARMGCQHGGTPREVPKSGRTTVPGAEIQAKSGPSWPSWAKIWTMLTNPGQHVANTGQSWPISARHIDQLLSNSANACPKSANMWHTSASVRRSWPDVASFGP